MPEHDKIDGTRSPAPTQAGPARRRDDQDKTLTEKTEEMAAKQEDARTQLRRR